MNGTAYSLRRRLIWLVTLAILGVGLLSTVVVYLRAHHEADELLDTQLAQLAETLLAIATGGKLDQFVDSGGERSQRHAVPIAYEIWRETAGAPERITLSVGHGGFSLPVAAGYSNHVHRDKNWRLFSVRDPDSAYLVIVGQRHSARDRLARETGLSLLVPMLLILPLMALLVGWVANRALRPVDALAQSVRALDPAALTPLDSAAPLPQEIVPLRDAFNALLERVSAALENERRFTADAAHELRTPLAALKIQAQVAQRAQPGGSQQHALGQVIAGVDRMTHLVEQLLTLARVEHATDVAPAAYDAAAALQGGCEPYRAATMHNRQSLELDADPDCTPLLERSWFEIAVRNLVANAVQYAGPGARIRVTLRCDAGRARLTVCDDGPGLPSAARTSLRARFARGETEAEGCGLGLSIVERIAQRSGARLTLEDGLPRTDGGVGLAVCLDCPQAPADAGTGNPDAAG
jgi:two-component system sensor histidine kinase QseC